MYLTSENNMKKAQLKRYFPNSMIKNNTFVHSGSLQKRVKSQQYSICLADVLRSQNVNVVQEWESVKNDKKFKIKLKINIWADFEDSTSFSFFSLF